MKNILLLYLLLFFPDQAAAAVYPWMENPNTKTVLADRIEVPRGYQRVETASESFGDWLRHLPLKQNGTAVILYNGQRKTNQHAHVAVVDIDTGKRDLQQCADAVMRLRAEYLYSRKEFSSIHFNFTSGHRAAFAKWIQGYRPKVNGNRVSWTKTASPGSSYKIFRKFLDTVFTYAGSYSLSRELKPIANVHDITIGDVFIKGGFPGHAVIVVDMAWNKKTGQKIFLLAQSYMPAQDIHILKNPMDTSLSPWYDLDFGSTLYTPEWTFHKHELKRFP